MLQVRIFRREMQHLAAKFVGGGAVHVVDPNVDLRYLFEKEEDLRRSLEERRSKVDIQEVKKNYEQWWQKHELWKNAEKETAGAAKKELRDCQEGLLNALALPNFVHSVGKVEKPMLKPTKHAEYLCPKGLMRVDKTNELVHLVGYPVLLQSQIKAQLMDLFADAQLISPSAFVRAAVLEGVNLKVEDFPSFNDGSSSFPKTYIVGCSLASMLSPFIRTQFTDNNTWPMTLQCSGMAYYAKRTATDLAYARQRLKHSVLSLNVNSENTENFITSASKSIAGFLDEGLGLEVKARETRGKELKNYESQATVFEDMGLEVARISRIDDYISRRLNITTESGDFLHMVYIQVDIDRVIARLIDGLIDGREVPQMLRKAMSAV